MQFYYFFHIFSSFSWFRSLDSNNQLVYSIVKLKRECQKTCIGIITENRMISLVLNEFFFECHVQCLSTLTFLSFLSLSRYTLRKTFQSFKLHIFFESMMRKIICINRMKNRRIFIWLKFKIN